jgi:ferredoxin, 2Fe-2S
MSAMPESVSRGLAAMSAVTVHADDGSTKTFEPTTDKSLMLQLRPLQVGVLGICGGNMMCGTCHVYVHEPWLEQLPAPSEYELQMLAEVPGRTDNSRLSCQLRFRDALDGLEITVGPHD